MSALSPRMLGTVVVLALACSAAGCGGGGASSRVTLHGFTFTVKRVASGNGLVAVVLESRPGDGVNKSTVSLIDGDGVRHAPVMESPKLPGKTESSERGLFFRGSAAELKGAKLRIVVGGDVGTISIDQAPLGALPAQPTISSPVPTHHTPTELCKTKGIRYDGQTREGAPVCFTLSADGASLLESAWSFVHASGCPQEAAGSERSTYPGDLDASGHFDNPDGFRGTVRGATASGEAEDQEICSDKTFTWTARRLP